MDELMTVDERAVDEMDPQEAGSTFMLGREGWEVADYLDPVDDWSLLDDGSYLSPDGTIRTWPAAGPAPV
jgi:hypothetical protein